MAKTHWNTIVDTKYLSGEEIFGTKPILTILDFKKEEVVGDGGRKENCGILYWQENVKPMIVNLTNVKQISKLLGSPFREDWQGKQIQLTTEKIKAFGQLWNAIRVCKELPKPTATVPPCNDCNNDIQALGEYSAGQIAKHTTKTYGVPLCADCGNKRKSAAKIKENEVSENGQQSN